MCLDADCVSNISFGALQGGYHELVQEPAGVKEQFVDECISWVLKRGARATSKL